MPLGTATRAQGRVAQRLQRHLRGHRLEPHRLVRAGLHVLQPTELLERGRLAVGADGAHLGHGPGQRLRVAPRQVDHPRDGVGGGVLAREQHGQHVARDQPVVDAAVRLVRRGDLKPSTATLTSAMLAASLRPAALRRMCHIANGAKMRPNSTGKILSRWRWITSSSDDSVSTGDPKRWARTRGTTARAADAAARA
jgi:hypothetical protein